MLATRSRAQSTARAIAADRSAPANLSSYRPGKARDGDFESRLRTSASASVAEDHYPVGTGLGWHRDLGKTAAFIYYAHPTWRPAWGGELLYAHPNPAADSSRAATCVEPADSEFQDFYREFDDPASAEKGCGGFAAPTPNRLILIRGGVGHTIKKVDAAAGEAFRASISGFFIHE